MVVLGKVLVNSVNRDLYAPVEAKVLFCCYFDLYLNKVLTYCEHSVLYKDTQTPCDLLEFIFISWNTLNEYN